ncbi:MAG TPA: protein kinase [Anaerolineae bacterium]|nr:protein kinase [Anaerolineae bacterium]
MTRRINPFVYGRYAPLSHFVGRRAEIDACYNALVGPVCGSVAISGEPRMGKTSLLHAIAEIGLGEGWARPGTRTVFVYVDCQSISRFSPTRFWQRVLTLLARALSNADVPDVLPAIQALVEQERIEATGFEAILHALRERQVVLVLLLDEFEWVIKRDVKSLPITRNFLSSLRGLINHAPDALSLIIASQQPLNVLYQGIGGEGSPFYNNFVFRRLHPLDPADADELIARRLAGSEVTFTPQDRQYIDQVAGTHPFLVQLACALVFDVRSQDLPAEHDLIGARFEEEARHHFDQIWEISSPEERTVLLLIAWRWWTRRLGAAPQQDEHAYWAFLRRFERDMISVVERGLVVGAEDEPRPISSVFAWWIINTVRAGYPALVTPDPASVPGEEASHISQVIQQVRDSGSQIIRSMSVAPFNVPRMPYQNPPPALAARNALDLSSTRPEQIGRYEILSLLGEGGMGVVYQAFDPALNRQVAVKVVRTDVLGYTPDLLRVQQEAQLAGQLSHPNIVTLYDVTYEATRAYIVMEYLEGRTLAQLLRSDVRLPAQLAVAYVEQLADGLDYAHHHGIIHRDLKPSNVMILDNGRVKITDFGLAKLVHGSTLTRSGHLIGTPNYMSPEQARSVEVVPQSDQFALGIVAYRMLTGRLPFGADVFQTVLKQIAESEPAPIAPTELPESIALTDILLKVLAKQPNDRYTTCREFAVALRLWLELAFESEKTPLA